MEAAEITAPDTFLIGGAGFSERERCPFQQAVDGLECIWKCMRDRVKAFVRELLHRNGTQNILLIAAGH